MDQPPPTDLEPRWTPLVQVLASMITLAPEYVVLQAYTDHDGECGPYVQTLQEDEGALTIEAVSNQFADPPFGPDAMTTLLEMGWNEPIPDDGLPNYWIILNPDEVEPGRVAEFLVRTLRDAFLVTPGDSFEMAPQDLFVEIVDGEFGFKPKMSFAKFDLEDWKRRNPSLWRD